MGEPTDEDIRDAVKELVKAAYDKAIEQATEQWTDPGGGGHRNTPSDEQKENYRKQGEELKQRFEEILSPKPEDFETLISIMNAVQGSLGAYEATKDTSSDPVRIAGDDGFEQASTAMVELTGWGGELRNQFLDNYLVPLFPGIVSTQGNVARFLSQHARLMKRVYERRRRDAKKIAEQGQVAIEAIVESKGSDLKLFLSIIGGLVGFASAAVGPFIGTAGSLGVGLSSAAVSAASAIGGNFIPADGDPVPLGADTVKEVVDNIYEALKKNDEIMREEEAEILESLQLLEGVIYPMVGGSDALVKAGSDLVPMQPKIFTVTDPKDLREGVTAYDGGPAYSDDDDSGASDSGGSDDSKGGGRGSYVGDEPPEDWDGSVFDPS